MSNLYLYMFQSRNKDNKNIPKFKEHAQMVLEYQDNETSVIESFKQFAANGLPGEQSRLYRSVNSRNEEKIREEFIIRLLRDKPSMTQLNRTLASVAQQVQDHDESKWLFDFDVDNDKLAEDFKKDIKRFACDNSNIFFYNYEIEAHKTPHGYAIIVPHGFDTRELMEKWQQHGVTLKKDAMLFLDMIKKEKQKQ